MKPHFATQIIVVLLLVVSAQAVSRVLETMQSRALVETKATTDKESLDAFSKFLFDSYVNADPTTALALAAAHLGDEVDETVEAYKRNNEQQPELKTLLRMFEMIVYYEYHRINKVAYKKQDLLDYQTQFATEMEKAMASTSLTGSCFFQDLDRIHLKGATITSKVATPTELVTLLKGNNNLVVTTGSFITRKTHIIKPEEYNYFYHYCAGTTKSATSRFSLNAKPDKRGEVFGCLIKEVVDKKLGDAKFCTIYEPNSGSLPYRFDLSDNVVVYFNPTNEDAVKTAVTNCLKNNHGSELLYMAEPVTGVPGAFTAQESRYGSFGSARARAYGAAMQEYVDAHGSTLDDFKTQVAKALTKLKIDPSNPSRNL